MAGEIKLPQEKPSRESEQLAPLSGAPVPVSGIWRPDHNNCANVAELWLRKNAFFPHCPCCGQAAGFILVEEIAHISDDPDFQ